MSAFFDWLLFTGFMPHGHCYLWKPGLIWLHFASDVVIALAYATIPMTLLHFARRRRDVPFHWVFLAFGAFIVACGATHVMEVVTLWVPVYWLSGVVKLITAAASIVTAVALVRIMPAAVALPSPEDLRRANRALEAQARELKAAVEAKDRFLATMSHELRTPLNAIIGFTALLLAKRQGPLTPDQEEDLETVRSSGEHLLSLINDLLDLAKVTSGHVDLVAEDVPVAALVAEAGTALRPTAAKKNLLLEVDAPDDLAVHTNRRALSQIVLNLVSNAVRFTERGRVRVEARHAQGGEQRQVEISVADTGIGIPKDALPRLFLPFSQLDASHPRAEGGTGLGLHLSSKLAELLGGRFMVESEPGHGSRFTLILPRGDVGVAARAEAASVAEQPDAAAVARVEGPSRPASFSSRTTRRTNA